MKLLHRLTYLYLLLPFALFALGWLRLIFALPLVALLIWIFFRAKPSNPPTFQALNLHPSAFILIFLWVFLSGIGGYAFQNWDHNWRNAVFHDLIHYPLPVIYSSPEKGPIQMLVYYVGYWLPAVFIGKAFGWGAANLALFLWTWLGVTLVTLRVSASLKISALKAALLLIFFSGADALGALWLRPQYATLLAPISHLEIWAGGLQYSSFTTQLFWVFNQAIPAWLCFLLLLNAHRMEEKLTAGALAFFFAPLPAIAIFFYLALDLVEEVRAQFKETLKTAQWDALLAATLTFLVSFLYFSANPAAQTRGIQPLAASKILPFFLLEGGILWLALLPRHWCSPRFILTGVLLLGIPFFQIGNGADFVMRVSIAPLFFLMLTVGKTLSEKNLARPLRLALYALLLMGAITPLHEINRSIYRTAEYNLLPAAQRASPQTEPAVSLAKGGAPEDAHPAALVADEILSLAKLKDKLTKNFIANVRPSFYYRYLAPR